MADSIFSRFVKGLVAIGVGVIGAMVSSFVSMIMIVRYLSPEDFGALVLFQVVFVFLAETSSLGLNLAVQKFVAGAQDEQHRRKLINTVIYFRLFSILLIGPLLLFAEPVLARLFGSDSLSSLIIYVPFLFAVESLGKLFKSILQGLFRFKAVGLVEFLASVSHLAIVTLVLFLDQGLRGLVWAKLISLLLGYTFGYLAASIKQRLEFSPAILKEMLKFGFPLQLQYMVSFVFVRFDTLLIAPLLGPTGIAYYEVARKIPDTLQQLYEPFRSVYFPFVANMFASGARDKAAGMLNHSLRWLAFLTIFAVLVTLLFGKEIISLVFTESYLASFPAFVLLMAGFSLIVLESTLGYTLVAVGDSDKPLIINIVRAGTSLVGNLLLIPSMGYVGAAVVSVVSSLVAAPLDVVFLRRRALYTQIRAPLKTVLVFGACSVFFLLTGSSTLLLRVAVIVLYLLACVLLSVVTREDLGMIMREAKAITTRVTARWQAQSH